MVTIPLTESSLAALKNALRHLFPTVKSSHLTESIAHALGYRTHAALRSACADHAGQLVTLNVQRLTERLRALKYSVDSAFNFERLFGMVPGLVSTIPNDSQAEKRRRFEQLIKAAQDSESGGEGFNFADAKCVAVEAKAQGLLLTREDAEVLIEAVVKLTSVSEHVCREEIFPVLKYREALDTQSYNRLDKLIRQMGYQQVARLVGISRPTLEKLVSGSSRGPFFQHEDVQKAVIEKARAFLASGPEGES